MTEYTILGKRAPRVDAMDKATGRAMYSSDINLPGMLYAKALRSPYAHAKIRSLDVTKARALKGVTAVLTAADLPQRKYMEEFRMPYLAKDKVIYAGHPVAVVAAVTPAVAEEALALISVDYEPLPPVMDALEAIKPDSPLIHPGLCTGLKIGKQISKSAVPSNVTWHVESGSGDIEAGFKKAHLVLENTFRTQQVHQGYMEPRAAVASAAPDGKVTVWVDSQSNFQARDLIAEFLDIPVSHIKMMPIEVGGAFGAKQHHQQAPLCALLARKTGHPVKMVLTREEDFVATFPAPASTITMKMGVDKEGHITAAEYTIYMDIGAFYREVPDCVGSSTTGLSLYRIPNVSIKLFNVVTNKAPTGMYRAPNAPDAAFAVESHMDLLARALNMDPLDFRLINAVTEGDLMTNGTPFPRIGFKETLLKMKDYAGSRKKPEGKNLGTGIACGLWLGAAGASAATINLTGDGTVTLIVGSCDLNGSRTALAQVAAEEFGIPLDKVTVIIGDTDTAPFAPTSSGSRITRQMGTAVYNACQDAKAQLVELAAPQLGVKPEELKFINGQVQVPGIHDKTISLAALIRITAGKGGSGPITGTGATGSSVNAPMFAVQMADVEVDKETGKVKILSYAAAQDVGFAINPALIEGQIQGAVAQGIGRALMEDYAFKEGIMQNSNFLDYRMPTAVDMPFVDTMLVEVKSDVAPYGVRGVGEPPMIPTLAAVANAIHSATGVRLKELPMNPEAVLKAIRAE